MSTSQNYNDDLLDIILEQESEAQRTARLNRLRVAEIKRRFEEIDQVRIRALAAIAIDKNAEADRAKLIELEQEAQALREELATIETEGT